MNLSPLTTKLSARLRGRASDSRDQENARNLILSSIWLGFIDGGIMTYLPVWLARMGATPATLSILSAGPQLVNVLVLLPAGAFVQRQKDIVRVANSAALVYRCGFVLMALLPFFLRPPDVIAAAIVLWIVLTVPNSLFYPAFMAAIERAIPPPMRPRVNATRWALYSLVGAIAIPAIGAMIDLLALPTGFQLAFVISFIGTLPNIYFFGKLRIEPLQSSSTPGVAAGSAAARLRSFVTPFFESKPFVRFNVATAAFRVCLSMPAGLYSIYWVDNLHASNTVIGIRGMVAYAALVVGYPLWGRVVNRIGHRTLLFFAALIGLYPICTGFSRSAEWLIPVAVLWGVFVAAIDIGLVDVLLLSCPDGKHPTFTAAANVLASVENFIGPLLGAALAEWIGVPQALVVSGVLMIVSGAFFILLPDREEERLQQRRGEAVDEVG